MNRDELIRKLRSHPRPVVVEFWASWCLPCKRMAPDLEKAGQEYAGRVDLWRFNADEHPELLRDLGIMGIPTLVAFSGEQETFRNTGVRTLKQLQEIFASALAGKPAVRALAGGERFLRAGAGLGLAGLGLLAGSSAWPLFIAAGLVVFSAVYDRCPVYRALVGMLKARK